MSAPTQIDRPFRIKVESLGDDDLLLDSFTGVERISDPFHFSLRVLSSNADLNMQSLLTKAVVLSIALEDGSERQIHGNICRMKLMKVGGDNMAGYEIEMVAWLWFLTLFSDCRIFQNMTVPNIVQQVFQTRGFTDFKLALQGSYTTREYCVQYRETDFNFVSRLLEEEGIFYFFQHTEDKHIMVLADMTSSFVSCPDQPNNASVAYAPATGGLLEDDVIFALEEEYRVQTGTATLSDYDFTKPNSSLLTTLKSSQPGEVYDYPGKYTTKDDGSNYAKIRLEELEAGISTMRGDSNCMTLQSGYTFTLTGHYRTSANIEYTLVMVDHQGQNTSYMAGQMDPFAYRNSFEAIPNSLQFRPARRARKPLIEGTQTALVVGKSGEEIWTDQYGRVVVQFYWDRLGTCNENSSCWIRVAQGWAGKEWGFICIPRIGQEVVVSFLEGDPDRPLITGSVYNAVQTTPYTLPDNQTQSTWKSMSSKGGGGFNEIRFEDKKGSEQIFIHGEKDMDMRLKNDRREWIGEDRHLVVTRDKLEKTGRDSHLDLTRDHIEKIGRDHHLTISGKEAIAITGSHSLKVTGDVIEQFSGNHSSQVTQNLYLKGMNVVVEGLTGLTIKVGGSFVTVNSGGVQIFGPMVQINSGGSALSGSAGSPVSPLSPNAAANASDANPGATTSVTPGTPATPASMTLDQISPASPSPPPGAAPPPNVAALPPAGKVSAASDAPTHNPNAPENQDKSHFIEVTLVDQEGSPVVGEPYKVTLADGSTVADGTTDSQGRARVDNIDPGTCSLTFPQLDQSTWKPK